MSYIFISIDAAAGTFRGVPDQPHTKSPDQIMLEISGTRGWAGRARKTMAPSKALSTKNLRNLLERKREIQGLLVEYELAWFLPFAENLLCVLVHFVP